VEQLQLFKWVMMAIEQRNLPKVKWLCDKYGQLYKQMENPDNKTNQLNHETWMKNLQILKDNPHLERPLIEEEEI